MKKPLEISTLSTSKTINTIEKPLTLKIELSFLAFILLKLKKD